MEAVKQEFDKNFKVKVQYKVRPYSNALGSASLTQFFGDRGEPPKKYPQKFRFFLIRSVWPKRAGL